MKLPIPDEPVSTLPEKRPAWLRWIAAEGTWQSCACSAALHLAVMLVLATLILPSQPERPLSFETTAERSSAPVESPQELALASIAVDQAAPQPAETRTATAEPLVFPTPQVTVNDGTEPPRPIPDPRDPLDEKLPVNKSQPRSRPAKAVPLVGDDNREGLKLSSSDSVEGAADKVRDDIRGRLAEKDTLVIWLLDGSISMQRELELMASRLEPFIKEAEARASPMLMHAVVAFGEKTQELVAPTKYSTPVLKALRSVPIDSTGVENTFAAVEDCVDRYIRRFPQQKKKNILLVVWTDESGEDLLRLEGTIAACRKFKASVSVVGPSAVLGSARGYHSYTAPENGLEYFLPVTRGPDTALREKLRLPYWHRTIPTTWDESERGPWQGNLAGWYGGSDLEAMLSGFGPYALIRLTRETGGSYTIFDRPRDRSPFRLEDLTPYLPDYRSPQEVAASINEIPLRRAVMAAVEMSHGNVNLAPPSMSFGNGLLGPSEFRTALPLQLVQQQQKVAAQAAFIEKALSHFGPEGMETEYEQERLPRWKAWYDLSRGRLLAASVRLAEYDAVARIISSPRFLNPQSNIVTIVPTRVLISGDEAEKRAQEAARLLNRCIRQNAETPWKHLAERELLQPIGLEPTQTYFKVQIRPVTGGVAVPRGSGPSLPRL